MATLKKIGFFRELFKHVTEGPILRECISDTPHPDEDKIISYLNLGVGIARRGSYVRDVLDPSNCGLLAEYFRRTGSTHGARI